MSVNKIRFRQAPRVRLRQLVVVCLASLLFLGLGALVLINITAKEESTAASVMSLAGVSVQQDTMPVLRGSINQKIVGVVIETSGRGLPLALNSITFFPRGTTLPFEKNLQNARLWFTGNDPEFSLQETIGQTVSRINGEEIVFTCSKELMRGKNHFWLTYDIPADAMAPGASVDAVCREVRIGSRVVSPDAPRPAGKRFILSNVPYYSMGSLSLNKVASWNSHRDGSGHPPRQLNETRNSYFIQAGHRMISSTGGNLQTLVVEKGGELKITSPLRLGSVQVACGGVLIADTSVADEWFINDLSLESGSLYYHNTTGPVPAFQVNCSRGSVQVVLEVGKTSFERLSSLGTLRFELGKQEILPSGIELPVIQGDLVLKGTGKSGLVSSGLDTMHIKGDFILEGGEFWGSKNGQHHIAVGGRFVMRSGTFSDASVSGGSTVLDVSGDIILLGGQFTTSKSLSSKMTIGGHGPIESRWIQRNECNVSLGNIELLSGRRLFLKGEQMGPLASNRKIDVQSGAELLCEQAIITGAGAFVLNDEATIGIGHPEGLHSKQNAGNIRTASRQFHAGATFLFYTESDPQVTGKFETYPAGQPLRRMIVRKAFPSQAVLLSQDIHLTEPCRVVMGDIRPNGFALLQDPQGR